MKSQTPYNQTPRKTPRLQMLATLTSSYPNVYYPQSLLTLSWTRAYDLEGAGLLTRQDEKAHLRACSSEDDGELDGVLVWVAHANSRGLGVFTGLAGWLGRKLKSGVM